MVTYLRTYEHTGGFIRFLELSTESPKSNDTLVARRISRVRLGCKYHSPIRETTDFRTGAGNIRYEPGAPSAR